MICAVLFFVEHPRAACGACPSSRWALLASVSVLLGTAYPAFVQQFRVTPQEHQREAALHRGQHRGRRSARSASTRTSTSQERPVRAARDRRGPRRRTRRRSTTSGCGGPPSCSRTSSRCSASDSTTSSRTSTSTGTSVDGERRVLMVSGREVAQGEHPGRGATWQNEHLVYTHGFGAVAAQVNAATTEGVAGPRARRTSRPAGEPLTDPAAHLLRGGDATSPFVMSTPGRPSWTTRARRTDARTYDGRGWHPDGRRRCSGRCSRGASAT